MTYFMKYHNHIFRKYDKFLFLVLIIFTTAFMLNAYNAIPIADDYCNYANTQRLGVLGFTKGIYLNWSGRLLTTLALATTNYIIPLENQNLISVLLSFLYLLFLYQFSKIITKESTEKKEAFIVFALLSVVTWFAYSQVLGRIVIWYTGGMVYTLCYILIPYFFIEFMKCYETKKYSIALIVLSVLLANSIETVPPTIIFFMAFYIALKKEFFKKESFKYFFFVSLIITIASIPLFISPGNFARAKTVSPSAGVSSFNLFLSYFNVGKAFISSAKNTALLSIAMGFICSFFLGESSRNNRKMIGLCLIAAAIGSALPMGFASQHNGSRPASLFVFLFSFGLFSLLSSVKIYSLQKLKEIIPGVLLLITSIFVLFDVQRGLPMRNHFIERDIHLKSKANSNEDIVVEIYRGKSPRSLNNHDMKPNADHWINGCIAKHYKLKSIRLIE